MSKESKATLREYDIKWFEDGNLGPYWRVLNLNDFNKHNEGYIHVIEYSALLEERAKSARLLEVIKQVKVHLRAPVHFDALVQMSQICGDAIEEYNQSEGGDER